MKTYGIRKPLTKANILDKVDSYNIFKKYCEGFYKYGELFKSPLRDNDKHPSASIILYRGDLLFKDFGENSYRAINFVARLYGLSYVEAMQKINVDFDLGLYSELPYVSSGEKSVIYTTPEITEKTNSIIKIKRRNWEDRDLNYWKQFEIQLKTLINFDVKPISHFTINGNLYFSDLLSYSYDYYIEEDIFRRKIYQPYSLYKWFSNGGLIVQGEGMLPKEGDLLIITSSLKDVMCLYEMNYIAIAPPSEVTFLPLPYFEKQKKRFNKIVCFMNNDETGKKMNRQWKDEFGLDFIEIPEEYKEKDISDFIKVFGIKNAKLLIDEKLNSVR